jgi:hypothetical protein
MEILIFVVLVIGTAVLLRPVRDALWLRMANLRDALISQAEELLGREIVYGSLGPSVLGTLDIRDIQVYGADGSPVLRIARFRVSYSLLTIISNLIRKTPDTVIESLHSVQIDRPVLTVDVNRDADLINLIFKQGTASASPSLDFVPEGLSFRVKNGECSITADTSHFGIDGLTFGASTRTGRLRFQGALNGSVSIDGLAGATGAGGLIPDILRESLKAQTSLRISGSCTTDLQSGNAQVNIVSLAGDLFRFQPLNLNLALGNKDLTLKKVNDRAPFDFSAAYQLDSGRLSLDFLCDHFAIRDILSLSGALKTYTPWLAISISGAASLEQEPAGTLGYTVDMAGVVPEGLLPLGRADFSLAGRGDTDYIHVDTLAVALPQGKFRFQGGVGLKPLAPQGRVSISDLSLSGNEQVTANFIIATQDNVQGREFRLFGETATFGTITLSDLDGSIMLEDTGLSFLVSALRFDEPAPDSDRAPPAQMALDGSFDYQSRYVEARIVLDTFPVRDMVDLVRPFVPLAETVPAQLDQVYLSTETFINTDFTHISYNALEVVIAYRGNEDLAAHLSVSGTDQRFEIRNSRILWNNGELGITGYANLMNPLDITFALETSYMDMSYYLEGTILDSRLISIQGSNGFKVEITMTDQRGYAGYIEVEDLLFPVGPLWSALKLSVPYEGRFIRFSLMAFLRFDSPESWYVNLDRLEIGDIQTPVSPMTSLRLAGNVNQDRATFSQLVFNDSIGMLFGNCSLSWNRAFSDITGTLVLGDGSERYELKGLYQNAHLHLGFNGSAMQVARIIPDSYDTVISGDIQVEWDSLDSFAATLNLSDLSARIQDTELRGTLSAAIDSQAVVLKDLQMTYGGIAAAMPFFHLNLLEHRIETGVQIKGTLGGRDLETAFSLAVDFKPIDSWLHLPELINTFSGTLAIANARFDTLESTVPFSFMFSRAGSLISVSGGPQDMIRLRISDTGDFFAGLSAPSPIRGTIIGAIDAKTIDIQVPDLYVDLVSLWRFLPTQNVINFTSGFVTAALRIAGPLGDPEFFGVAQSNSVRIQIPQFLTQDVRPIPFNIVLEGNEMTFDAIPAGVGSGRGTINGWFLFERWIPDTFTLDILVPQGSSIPFGFDLLGIITRGKVSGNLNLSMADQILSVTGNLIPDDTEITLNAEELTATRSGEAASQGYFQIMTDITLRTGPKVEFIWPSAKFPIVQAVADMGTSLHIMSDSVTNRYSLVGDINLRSGEIFYFQRSFYIRQGILSFNENEIQFDPRISARAEVRDRTDDGPVTISLIIDNSPLQSFSVRFESSPALSQMEIISLFGQNLTGTTQEAGKDSDQIPLLASGLDFLAQTQVVRRFERIIQNFLRLDMFSARTQLLQNIATQTFRVQDPVDRSNSVGNYFDNTTVFVGKYIGSDMFVQWMTSFRYDENEHTLGGLSWRGLAIEPDIGIELRGPLFDIRWNITPLHFVESMCVEDVSFTVTWRRSGIFLKDCFTKPTK